MLYEKAFQKELWKAMRMDEAYAPLLSTLLEDYGLFPGLPVRYDLAN